MYSHLFHTIYNSEEDGALFSDMIYKVRIKIIKDYLEKLSFDEAEYFISELKRIGVVTGMG